MMWAERVQFLIPLNENHTARVRSLGRVKADNLVSSLKAALRIQVCDCCLQFH